MFFVTLVRGRQRDHPQPHHPRHAGPDRAPRARPSSLPASTTTHCGTRPPRRCCAGAARSTTSAAPPRSDTEIARRSRSRPATRWSSTTRPPTATTTVFEDPHTFDIRRTPNDHVTFGGGGTHFCLGANLARAEIKAMIREFVRRVPDRRAGRRAPPPALATSSTASSSMPVSLDAETDGTTLSDAVTPIHAITRSSSMHTDLCDAARHRVPDLRLHPLPRRRRRGEQGRRLRRARRGRLHARAARDRARTGSTSTSATSPTASTS